MAPEGDKASEARSWVMFKLLYSVVDVYSLISPIEGPPKHLNISEDEPPSSETGKTNEGECPKAPAIELAPVPPEIMR